MDPLITGEFSNDDSSLREDIDIAPGDEGDGEAPICGCEAGSPCKLWAGGGGLLGVAGLNDQDIQRCEKVEFECCDYCCG